MPIALILLAALAADAPAAKTTYYLGETRVLGVDGKPMGSLATLVKRELIPAESKIVESVLTMSSYPGEATTEFVATLSVKGNAFTIKEKGGVFVGEGELIGPPWEWTSWTSTTKVAGANGATVVSRDKVSGRGLAVTKDVFRPDGTPRARLVEDHATIDGATYELLRSKLLPKPGR